MNCVMHGLALPPKVKVTVIRHHGLFFSSRRRHTRYWRDWSSDVCSSDLDTFRKLEVKQLIADEGLYRELRDRFGEYFEGGMGAAALQKLLADFDLDAEAVSLRETIRSGKGQRKLRALKRLKVVAAFQQTRRSEEHTSELQSRQYLVCRLLLEKNNP